MIKNVSSTFKANCKKDSVKYREYIVIDNKEVDIKGNLSDTAYKDTTFFGKFNLKMLKFETENDIDYKKKEFTYYKEVDGESLKIGTFIVTDVSDSDTFESVNVTAYDYGLKFANPYKSTLNYLDGNVTLFQVIQEICTNCEVELENISLPNGAFIVDSNQFVNGEQFGDVVAQASGINGMFATINSNDKLEFIFTNETSEIIEDYVELDDKRDTHPITSVLVAPSEELATAGAVMKDQALINQYGEHWLKIYDSYFANSTTKCQQLISAIFNQVKGFAYSSFKSEYSFLPYLTLGDKIKFKNKEGKLVNSVILRYETNYDEMILEAPSIINASVEYELPETPEETSKKALVKVDQANGEIELIAKATEELTTKTTQLRLDVDKIEGEISDIADITTTIEGTGTLVANNINESEPIYLRIYPTNSDLKCLYPSETLYPSEDLVPLELYLLFHCTSEEYDISYTLPDLYWLNKDVYDEFVLDYDNQECYIVRRVSVVDGVKTALTNSITENLPYPNIPLINGDYQISIPYQTTGYIYARLMVQNIYTNQFATKIELNSKITQTATEINLEVSKKVGNDEVISRINQTPEAITIQANKVNIGGVINAINNNTTTTIDGNKITTGSINASKVASDIITTNNFNAQNINANNITTGTLSTSRLSSDVITTKNFNAQSINADNIKSGTISGRTIRGGSINGTSIKGGSIKIGSRETTIASNGEVSIYPDTGGVYRFADGAVRFNANKGAVIASSSNGSVYAGSGNLDLKACSGHNAYLGCMANSNGTNEKSGVICTNGILKFKSAGYCTYNGSTVFGSSSKATKENIVDLKEEQKEEVYELIKNIPTKQYDYKKEYGKPFNYGFVIEDIEDTKLKDLLHITQAENNEDIKMYSTEDLARLELITIQMLMNKIEKLEARIEKLEKESE